MKVKLFFTDDHKLWTLKIQDFKGEEMQQGENYHEELSNHFDILN